MTELFWNHGYVIIVLNRALDSSMRFSLSLSNKICWRKMRLSEFELIELSTKGTCSYGHIESLAHLEDSIVSDPPDRTPREQLRI